MSTPAGAASPQPGEPAGAAYMLERAWLGDRVADDVLVEITEGRLATVRPEAGEDAGVTARRVPGLTVPGFANGHSHAFHRALRGRTQRERGTFWTWRERMYALAARLDPDDLYALARATYAEMALAGYTAVGEFHYLHHQPDGTPYDDPHAMADALVAAARAAGIRITLLDTCYVSSGFGAPPEGVQRRYSDGDAEQWARRTEDLAARYARVPGVRIGAAIHSVRAVPRDQLPTVVAAAGERPLHVHLSEQEQENLDCREAYDLTPTGVLAAAGVLGPGTTAVHATHLTGDDVRLLGESGTHVCFCPTTERDLGDGIGPGRRLDGAGSPLTFGSDSQAVIDPCEEVRAAELDERLADQSRGHWAADELLAAATVHGHASLGDPGAGRITVGAPADLVTVDTASPRTAGTGADESTLVFAATAADVRQVVVDGRTVLDAGSTAEQRAAVGHELDAVVTRLWRRPE